MSFRRSVRQAMLVPLVMLSVGSVFVALLVLGVRAAHRWIDHTDVVIGRASLLQKLTSERESALRGYLLSHERAFLDQFNTVDLRLSPIFDELQDLVADDATQIEKLREARIEVFRSRHHAAQQIDRVGTGASLEAIAAHVSEGTAITHHILTSLEEFIAAEQEMRPRRVRRADDLTLYALVLGAAFGVVVGGGIALATADRMRFVRRRYLALLEEQARMDRAIAEANARLVDADRRKDEFLGLLSHELRNPLAPIRNSIQVLGRTDPASERARRARTILERQVNHLTRLVEDLLDIKRISAGKMRIRPERIDLVSRVREIVEDMRAAFVQKGVRLELRVPAEPIWIDADATRIAQIVTNLLQNAAKFTDAPGVVTVAVETDAGRAHLRVRDTGIGIPPELLESLFEPFVQGPQTLDRSRGGLGLGLALVRGIVELHRGNVTVQSTPGQGTEFDVVLPLSASVSPLDRRKSPIRPPSERRRILIVEDNQDAAESLRDLLEMVGGHDVAIARDGAEGVEMARKLRPDVVLCDLGLPTLDGYEVARRLRAGAEELSTVLVALSGYAAPEDVERSMRAGFDYHIPKPPDLEALLRILAVGPERREKTAPSTADRSATGGSPDGRRA